MEKIQCPTLIIHGKSDDLIPWSHSLDLINKCKCAAKLVTPHEMKHNNFDIVKDLIVHIKEFFSIFEDEFNNTDSDSIDYFETEVEDSKICNNIHFPLFMFSDPKDE